VTADRVVAVEAVNSPRDFLAARKLIGSAAPVDVDELLKPGADLGPRAR
jgi:hypothetical protein